MRPAIGRDFLRPDLPPLVGADVLRGQAGCFVDAGGPGLGPFRFRDPFEDAALRGAGERVEVAPGLRMARQSLGEVGRRAEMFPLSSTI